MRIENVPITEIKVGRRFRREYGDLDALAENIKQRGLLQPIGLNSYYNLVFGERRLHACHQLGWTTIPAVIFDVDSILLGEHDENEFRQNFTPTERAAIGKAIEAELGAKERRGNPQLAANAANSEKGRTVDLAAKRAGFKSAETFERAKQVADKGTPELKAAVDAGKVSISAGAAIASQPAAEQRKILEMPKEEQQSTLRQIYKTKAQRTCNEQRAYDLRVFRGLAEAVETIANFSVDSRATWAGLARVCAYRVSEQLPRAVACLVRLDKEHPNAPRKPELVGKTAQ